MPSATEACARRSPGPGSWSAPPPRPCSCLSASVPIPLPRAVALPPQAFALSSPSPSSYVPSPLIPHNFLSSMDHCPHPFPPSWTCNPRGACWLPRDHARLLPGRASERDKRVTWASTASTVDSRRRLVAFLAAHLRGSEALGAARVLGDALTAVAVGTLILANDPETIAEQAEAAPASAAGELPLLADLIEALVQAAQDHGLPLPARRSALEGIQRFVRVALLLYVSEFVQSTAGQRSGGASAPTQPPRASPTSQAASSSSSSSTASAAPQQEVLERLCVVALDALIALQGSAAPDERGLAGASPVVLNAFAALCDCIESPSIRVRKRVSCVLRGFHVLEIVGALKAELAASRAQLARAREDAQHIQARAEREAAEAYATGFF